MEDHQLALGLSEGGQSEIHLSFPRLNHFWNDSGVLGLYRCLIDSVHAPSQRESAEREGDYREVFGIEANLTRDALELSGAPEALKQALDAAYDRLVERYYNLSTEKQRNDTSAHNFYYDSKTDRFRPFPKKKPKGIAAFIYDKAPRPSGDQAKWVGEPAGQLPEEWSHLQDRLDAFLQSNKLSAGPPAGMLIDGPNRIKPNVTIAIKEGKPKGVCFLCGQPSTTLEKISQTVFPFITGDSGILSFFSGASEVNKVCWRCAFVGKFVPVNGFYTTAGDSLHLFFPFAPSLTKMNEVYGKLQAAAFAFTDPDYWKNFEVQLGGYFARSHELAFAFLHALYQRLFNSNEIEEDADFDCDLFSFALENAPVSFAVVSTMAKGNTQMPTEAYLFDDLAYLFRLFRLTERHETDWKNLAANLVDSTAAKKEDYSLRRNRIMRLMLDKRSILREAESFAYHVNRQKQRAIGPLARFVTLYEELIHKGGGMESQAREAAVTLGRRVGGAVAAERGKKGNLFALRKCRTVADFLNELNRLQFRYQIAIPPAVYEGHLTEENFDEFRGFCLLAALNTFNAGMARQEQAETAEATQ